MNKHHNPLDSAERSMAWEDVIAATALRDSVDTIKAKRL
jgi:hypothetical protein